MTEALTTQDLKLVERINLLAFSGVTPEGKPLGPEIRDHLRNYADLLAHRSPQNQGESGTGLEQHRLALYPSKPGETRSGFSTDGVCVEGDEDSMARVRSWHFDATGRLPSAIERLKEAEANLVFANAEIAHLKAAAPSPSPVGEKGELASRDHDLTTSAATPDGAAMIWVVMATSGEWSDRSEWPIEAHLSKTRAEDRVTDLSERVRAAKAELGPSPYCGEDDLGDDAEWEVWWAKEKRLQEQLSDVRVSDFDTTFFINPVPMARLEGQDGMAEAGPGTTQTPPTPSVQGENGKLLEAAKRMLARLDEPATNNAIFHGLTDHNIDDLSDVTRHLRAAIAAAEAQGSGESPLAELRAWCVARAVEAGVRAQSKSLASSLQSNWAMAADTFAGVIERIDEMDPSRAAQASEAGE